ncbi:MULTISPECIES: hypothetical protein [unclassified Corallococcus]|uniref:hypothetical protein n=1 Tax=unclassified Corallococcus TaxID=2685029 RepID=UPI001A8D9074|nr:MULTISPECIES: hypothetical protein [unclassified Corallococcus]MBN9686388.1 hypothetical protein [Corallococcus sp. NCSPR001]WAS82185.1 hypothetical protein O0N60_22970 [Corallococcus sp. NCRR]
MSQGGEGTDRSLADLMAGVAVVFLLLAVIFILDARQQREEAIREKEVAIGKVDSQKDGVQASLVALRAELVTLDTDLDGGFIEMSGLDGGVNALEIEFKNLQFGLGECRTPPEYVQQFRLGAVPLIERVCAAVDAMRDAGAEPSIILEGHTDDRPFLGTSGECGVRNGVSRFSFENNVRASASRAQEVFFTVRDQLPAASYARTCLDANFVVSGRGQTAPRIGTEGGDPANRRLVLRVRGDLRL